MLCIQSKGWECAELKHSHHRHMLWEVARLKSCVRNMAADVNATQWTRKPAIMIWSYLLPRTIYNFSLSTRGVNFLKFLIYNAHASAFWRRSSYALGINVGVHQTCFGFYVTLF